MGIKDLEGMGAGAGRVPAYFGHPPDRVTNYAGR